MYALKNHFLETSGGSRGMTGVVIVYVDQRPHPLLDEPRHQFGPPFQTLAPVYHFLVPTGSDCLDFLAITDQPKIDKVGCDRIYHLRHFIAVGHPRMIDQN